MDNVLSGNYFALNGLVQAFRETTLEKCSNGSHPNWCVFITCENSVIEILNDLLLFKQRINDCEVVFAIGSKTLKNLIEGVVSDKFIFIDIASSVGELTREMAQPNYSIKNKIIPLTPCELYVTESIILGRTPFQISKKIGGSIKTVSNKKRSAMRKLSVKSMVELVCKMKLWKSFGNPPIFNGDTK